MCYSRSEEKRDNGQLKTDNVVHCTLSLPAGRQALSILLFPFLKPRLAECERPHNLRMTLLQFLQADHQIEDDEEEDAEECDEHGVFLIGDAGRSGEIGEDVWKQCDDAHESPEERPEKCFPDGLLLPHDQVPGIEDCD